MSHGDRGKSKGYCPKHAGSSGGIHPDAPPFFYEGCPMCLEKLAAGKTTRDAGPYRGPQKMARAPQIYDKGFDRKKIERCRREAAERAKFLRQ
jgi:hypothetical protein